MKKTILMIAVIFTAFTTITKAQSELAKNEFNKTLTAYFDTKNALANDNVNLAAVGAKSLLTSVATFPIKSLPIAQQIIWKTQGEVVKKAANAMVVQKDLAAQRKSFWPLSSAMLELVKAFELNKNEVYVQHCPMAKKSWLNEVEAVQNPFYGSMMYDCGEITETITKK
jgi:Cu(I)/Ag(I) efflux system membrane fusion protein